MKKMLSTILLMFSLSVVIFGAKGELENKNGKYSGSTSIGLVVRGRIVDRIPQSMLVLNIEDGSGISSDTINFMHEEVESNEERKSKGKFIAQIYRENKYGEMKLVNLDRNIRAEILTVNNEKSSERVLKNVNGNEIGKISYELGKSKILNNKYEGEVVNKVAISNDKKGVFIDNNSSLKIVIEDLAMIH